MENTSYSSELSFGEFRNTIRSHKEVVHGEFGVQ